MNISERFDPRELCSRKLWQLVNARPDGSMSEADLHEAVAELAARRHYLSELIIIGILGEHE